MIDLTQKEVILLKILASLFGRDNVIPKMSVRAICEGAAEGKNQPLTQLFPKDIEKIALLFTVVNNEDTPKMVVEFAPEIIKHIDVYELERERTISNLLDAAEVRYVTITMKDFDDLTDPACDREFLVKFFEDKCGLVSVEDDAEVGEL